MEKSAKALLSPRIGPRTDCVISQQRSSVHTEGQKKIIGLPMESIILREKFRAVCVLNVFVYDFVIAENIYSAFAVMS